MSIESLNNLFTANNIKANAVAKIDGLTHTMYHIDLDPTLLALPSNIKIAIQRVLLGKEIKMVDFIPNTPYMGIEVANTARPLIKLTDCKYDLKGLEFVVGRNNTGDVIRDLAKAPHMLIAGKTGSGKSVFINTLIMSLLKNNNPETLHLHLVDPKQVELGIYRNHPCVKSLSTTAKDAITSLESLVYEMERRYTMLNNGGFRNITEYNASKSPKMPYIVMVFDEFGDYMTTKSNRASIEVAVTRIAQKARAAGIHLILATQRPSVDVITGTIKANMTVRVAFSCTSKVDSMTIIGNGDAEGLQGNGDMLISFNGTLERVQGAYIDSTEITTLLARVPKFTPKGAVKTTITESIMNMCSAVVKNGTGVVAKHNEHSFDVVKSMSTSDLKFTLDFTK